MSHSRIGRPGDLETVWLTLASNVQVGISLIEALELDRKGFARLYRTHVWGASRREANEWADKQLLKRAEAYRDASQAAL